MNPTPETIAASAVTASAVSASDGGQAALAEQLQTWQPAADALQGRVILVTGASAGIGRSVALACARLGATVLLLGRTVSRLEKVYDRIEQAGGAQPALLPLNLATAQPAEYQQLADNIQTQIGRLDGIVHCAAVLGRLTPVAQYDPLQWEEVMRVNLHAPLMLTQVCLPLLRESADASVVFATSTVGHAVRPFWAAYGVSKAGLEYVSQLLSLEHANLPQLRFNCVNPGATRTNMRAHAYPGENALNNPLPAQRIAPFIYLLSPEGRACHGLMIDAPVTAHWPDDRDPDDRNPDEQAPPAYEINPDLGFPAE